MAEQHGFDDTHMQLLLQKSAVGDLAAFHELYELTNHKVYAYVNRVLNEKTDVDEVFVETYAEVWRNAGEFREQSTIMSWIIGIARKLSLDLLNRFTTDGNAGDYSDFAGEDDTPVNTPQRTKLLHDALAQLPQIHREVLGLILLPEFSHEHIAHVMSIPLNTVKTRVFYAKTALKEKLQATGISSNDY